MNSIPSSPDSSAIRVVPQDRLWLGIGVIVVFVVWLFWDFFVQQGRFAINQQADWGHTLVIPFISGYFVWLNREQILSEPFKPAWAGLLVLVLGVGWYSLIALGPAAFKHHNLMGIGVALTIIGLSLLFFGWRPMRWLWFPLAYLIIFGQTLSDSALLRFTQFLQDIAAHGSYWGLTIFGYDMSKEGNTLRIHQGGEIIPVNIAEACSGMRMVVAFLALGVAMSYRGLDLWWQRVILVLCAFPTALFINVLRVMTLGVLATYDSGMADGDFHSMIGLLWLIPAFFIYLGIMWILRNLVMHEDAPEREEATEPLSIRFNSSVRRTFVIACIVLVGGGIGLQYAMQALNIYLRKSPVELRSSLANLPTKIDGWTMLQDIRLPETGVEELGTDVYMSRTYRSEEIEGNPIVHFHLAYYTGTIDMVPHVADRCMVAGGLEKRQSPINRPMPIETSSWAEDPEYTIDGSPFMVQTSQSWLTGEETLVRMPHGDFELRTTEFHDPKIPNSRIYAGYFFIANGRLTPEAGGVRILAYQPKDKYAYYCKVQFTISGGRDFTADQFVDVSTGFFEPLLKELMRCLPDWAEIQSGVVTNED
tara:strand:- start:1257 stop:3029 length:1773 start_codon:yes stop_codon:yes gene_type:complete